jgi:integrase
MQAGKLCRVEQSLYRYEPTGAYYAKVKRSGKIVKKSLKTDKLPVARRMLRDFLGDLDRIDVGSGNVPLSAWITEHLGGLKQAPNTTHQKEIIARRVKKDWPGGAHVHLKDISPSHVRRWLAKYDFGPSAYNHHLWFIRGALEAAVEDRMIPYNPAGQVKARKLEKRTKPTPTYDQFLEIVADLRAQSCNGHGAEDTADYIEFAGEAGLGQAEISGLLRQHVDLEASRLTLYRVKTRASFAIPIFPNIRPLIKRRLQKIGEGPTERLFPFDNCKKALEGATTRLGMPKFEPRSLRRLFITRALRRGIDVKTIASWQGHNDGGKLILQTYSIEVDSDHSQQMAERMGGSKRATKE